MLSPQLAPLTAGAAATSWWLDPVGIVVAGVLGSGYALGVTRVRGRGAGWPLGRSLTFLLGGVGSILLTSCSFLGVYAPVLRWVAVVQACLLLLVCPLLIGLGAPIALLQAARPAAAGAGPAWWRRPGRALWGLLRGAGVAPLVILAVTALLVFTPWLGWSVATTGARALTMVVLLGAGLVLALPITDEGARLGSLAYAAMLGLAIVEFLLDAVPGMVLRLNSHLLLAGHWVAVSRSWGPSPLADQQLAGDWLWFFAEAGDLPFLLILIVAWIKADAREASIQDAVLDQLALDEGQADGLMRPWWQTEERPHP
jgi:cytochrome c oxidase assembly factor CtaG